MDIRFDGKTAVITGGGQGLGKCVALSFAKAGANIVIGDINEKTAQETCKEIEELGVKAMYCLCDVSDPSQVDELMNMPKQLDIMVNVAGIVISNGIDTAPQDKIERLFDVNILGTSNTIRADIERMKPQKSGKILLFSSIAARTHGPSTAHYAASKAAVISMTHSAAHVCGPYNINVNAISPGIIRTAMWEYLLDQMVEKMGGDREQHWQNYIKATIPMGRAQEPQDIADAALFLCSDHAKNITGQTLSVCGGYYMGY